MDYRFNLEAAIDAWRRPLEHASSFSDEDIRELEGHLRDHIDRLVQTGLPEEEAFRTARRRIGLATDFEEEFSKVRWSKSRHRRSLITELTYEALMLRNQFKLAFRAMRRHPGFTAINIFGLGIGMACCLFMGLFVLHERSYDRFHEKADRIHRVIYDWAEGLDATAPPRSEFGAWGSAAPGPLLLEEFPEVQEIVRFSGGHSALFGRGEESFQEEHYFYADPTVFDIFDFEFIRGNAEGALDAPNTIVLTERVAQKYFGDSDPVGNQIILENEFSLDVTGVIRDLPSNSHMRIDMLLSMELMRKRSPDYMFDSWGYIDFYTYVLLRENADPATAKARFPEFVERYLSDEMQNREATFFMDLEPLSDIYLSPISERFSIGPEGSPVNNRVFSIAALFILLIACFNFMNLSVSQSMERAREVGVRKLLGSERRSLVRQFLLESGMLTLIAAALAAVIVVLARPAFEQLAGIAFPGFLLERGVVVSAIVLIVIAIGGMAGLYPALVLSRFEPVQVLKGTFSRSRRGTAIRKSLVVGQFAISGILLIGALVVRDQIHFMQNRDLGFDNQQQLLLDFGGDSSVRSQLPSFLQMWESHPSVHGAAAARTVPGEARPSATTFVENPQGEQQREVFQVFEVDFGYIEHLDIQVVAGRSYSPDFPSDSTSALIINESAARTWGYDDPSDAVGAAFSQWGSQGQVIGVIADFHHQSLHQQIAPLTLRFAPQSTSRFVLSVDTRNLTETLAALESMWKERVPHRPFLYHFLDDSFDAQYRADQRFGAMVGVFSVLAILVACLGLLGTAAYSVRQRTKEIGIRKALGATSRGISGLLVKDMLTLFATSAVVAIPVSVIFLDRWLDGFAFRTGINPFWILGAYAILLLAALSAIAYQTIRAAYTRPVECLRYE